jgi:hypothetical protein
MAHRTNGISACLLRYVACGFADATLPLQGLS